MNIRKLAEQMGVSYVGICRALKKHLHPHSYKILVRDMKEMDIVKRVE
jgi:hypothetical protein